MEKYGLYSVSTYVNKFNMHLFGILWLELIWITLEDFRNCLFVLLVSQSHRPMPDIAFSLLVKENQGNRAFVFFFFGCLCFWGYFLVLDFVVFIFWGRDKIKIVLKCQWKKDIYLYVKIDRYFNVPILMVVFIVDPDIQKLQLY